MNFQIQPVHVLLTLIVTAMTIIGILWRIAKLLANMGMKMDMLWTWYKDEHNINGKKAS